MPPNCPEVKIADHDDVEEAVVELGPWGGHESPAEEPTVRDDEVVRDEVLLPPAIDAIAHALVSIRRHDGEDCEEEAHPPAEDLHGSIHLLDHRAAGAELGDVHEEPRGRAAVEVSVLDPPYVDRKASVPPEAIEDFLRVRCPSKGPREVRAGADLGDREGGGWRGGNPSGQEGVHDLVHGPLTSNCEDELPTRTQGLPRNPRGVHRSAGDLGGNTEAGAGQSFRDPGRVPTCPTVRRPRIHNDGDNGITQRRYHPAIG